MNERININDLNENRIKQAIDNLTKFHIDKMQVFTANLDDDLDIVLQLIEKQQAEIEQLKSDFEIVDHECSRLEQEDIKKDKIINLIAGYIAKYYKNDDDINNFAKEVMKRGEWTNFKSILIEYFERKIEQ